MAARPNPKPTAALRRHTYFHGTPSEKWGKAILRSGLTPADDERLSRAPAGWLTPIPGRVYLTPQAGEAMSYALWDREGIDSRYGYLFAVPGRQVVDVMPDEDVVGEVMAQATRGCPGSGSRTSTPWSQAVIDAVCVDPELRERLAELVPELTPAMRKKLYGSRISYIAKAGKRVLKVMPDDLQIRLVELGSAFSALPSTGKFVPTKAWKIPRNLDRNDAYDLKYGDNKTVMRVLKRVAKPVSVKKTKRRSKKTGRSLVAKALR